MLLRIAVVMLETELAVKLAAFDPVRKVHRCLWCPKRYLKGDYYHGKRDFLLEVAYSLGELEDWGWLRDLERKEFLEEYG
jgi:hypothetical protein